MKTVMMMMMKILGLMIWMVVRRGSGQVVEWWMDGGWQWWFEGRQQITRKQKKNSALKREKLE